MYLYRCLSASLCAIAAVVVGGCAPVYVDPIAEVKAFAIAVPGDREQILSRSTAVLQEQGFGIEDRVPEKGYLMTSIKHRKLTTKECDCGTIDGVPALSRQDADTRYMFELFAAEGQLRFRTGIDGWIVRSSGDTLKLRCVSLGLLEKGVASEVIRRSAQ
jgi:hypothetical protein